MYSLFLLIFCFFFLNFSYFISYISFFSWVCFGFTILLFLFVFYWESVDFFFLVCFYKSWRLHIFLWSLLYLLASYVLIITIFQVFWCFELNLFFDTRETFVVTLFTCNNVFFLFCFCYLVFRSNIRKASMFFLLCGIRSLFGNLRPAFVFLWEKWKRIDPAAQWTPLFLKSRNFIGI